MPDQTESHDTDGKKRRSRGASFPSMSLPDAIAAITTIASMGSYHTKKEIAEYLGHSTTNSGAFAVKYAALRDFGFLSGRGDDIEVTDLGMKVAHPESETAKAQAVHKAFLRSETFNAVYNSLAPGTVLKKDHVGSRAVNQFGVSPASKSDFIDSFVDSAVAAGLAARVSEEEFEVLQAEPQHDDEDEDLPLDFGEEGRAAPRVRERGRGVVPVVHHPWQLENGEMLFQITVNGSLPAKAYGQIQSIIEQGDELAKLLGPAATDTDESSEEEVMS